MHEPQAAVQPDGTLVVGKHGQLDAQDLRPLGRHSRTRPASRQAAHALPLCFGRHRDAQRRRMAAPQAPAPPGCSPALPTMLAAALAPPARSRCGRAGRCRSGPASSVPHCRTATASGSGCTSGWLLMRAKARGHRPGWPGEGSSRNLRCTGLSLGVAEGGNAQGPRVAGLVVGENRVAGPSEGEAAGVARQTCRQRRRAAGVNRQRWCSTVRRSERSKRGPSARSVAAQGAGCVKAAADSCRSADF